MSSGLACRHSSRLTRSITGRVIVLSDKVVLLLLLLVVVVVLLMVLVERGLVMGL